MLKNNFKTVIISGFYTQISGLEKACPRDLPRDQVKPEKFHQFDYLYLKNCLKSLKSNQLMVV